MLNNYIKKSIKNQFHYKFTHFQAVFVDLVSEFLLKVNSSDIFILKGYAGTGKTTIVSALVKALRSNNMKTILLAPTGRAAKVFGNYAEYPAFTIHKHIYRQRSEVDGMGEFELDFNKSRDTLFIIDEASMLANDGGYSLFGSGNLLDDVIKYVYREGKNNKLLFVGDIAQLPPVGLDVSHALDSVYLQTRYHINTQEVELTEIIRQESNSEILTNATRLRNYLTENKQGELYLSADNVDVKHITGEDLVEELSDAYGKYGQEETLVITRSNKRANAYNEGIRRTILYKESEIASEDYLMVVKNNYFWKDDNKKMDFIANGEIVEVVQFLRAEEVYGFRFADVVLRFVNYDIELETKILLDTLTSEAPALTTEQNKMFYYKVLEDYEHLKNKTDRKKAVRENLYFNALQVKFAYAITCHKSQGGQWDTVFIDQSYLVEEMLNADYYRWLYTAVTRAKKKLFFVNFREEYQKIGG